MICTQPDEYNNREALCNATGEGPLLRNPGNHDPNRVPRLPTRADVDFTVGLREYETETMDRFANLSFRNVLEGTRTHILSLFCAVFSLNVTPASQARTMLSRSPSSCSFVVNIVKIMRVQCGNHEELPDMQTPPVSKRGRGEGEEEKREAGACRAFRHFYSKVRMGSA